MRDFECLCDWRSNLGHENKTKRLTWSCEGSPLFQELMSDSVRKKKNGYFVVHVKPKPHEHFQFDFYRSIEFWVLTYQIVTYTKEAVIASQFIPQVSLDSIKVNFSNEGYKFDLHCCDYIINRAFHTKKLLKWNGLVVHWCLYNK